MGALPNYFFFASFRTGSICTGSYDMQAAHVEVDGVYTNKPPCGAMRGHGCPHPRFAFESLLSMMAEDLGLDEESDREGSAKLLVVAAVGVLDPRHQLAGAEGLGQVIIGTDAQAGHPIRFFGAGGEHQNIHIRLGPQAGGLGQRELGDALVPIPLGIETPQSVRGPYGGRSEHERAACLRASLA